ncbi:hypothetical protein INR49_031462 [Caranx melampygus]|nr:hypothetical protein INR49_031462 [Caranx melampygus]
MCRSASCTFGFLLLLLTGKVESVVFEQSSPQIVRSGTEGLMINCSHDGSSSKRCCGTNTTRAAGL